jgi:hypothetical protein
MDGIDQNGDYKEKERVQIGLGDKKLRVNVDRYSNRPSLKDYANEQIGNVYNIDRFTPGVQNKDEKIISFKKFEIELNQNQEEKIDHNFSQVAAFVPDDFDNDSSDDEDDFNFTLPTSHTGPEDVINRNSISLLGPLDNTPQNPQNSQLYPTIPKLTIQTDVNNIPQYQLQTPSTQSGYTSVDLSERQYYDVPKTPLIKTPSQFSKSMFRPHTGDSIDNGGDTGGKEGESDGNDENDEQNEQNDSNLDQKIQNSPSALNFDDFDNGSNDELPSAPCFDDLKPDIPNRPQSATKTIKTTSQKPIKPLNKPSQPIQPPQSAIKSSIKPTQLTIIGKQSTLVNNKPSVTTTPIKKPLTTAPNTPTPTPTRPIGSSIRSNGTFSVPNRTGLNINNNAPPSAASSAGTPPRSNTTTTTPIRSNLSSSLTKPTPIPPSVQKTSSRVMVLPPLPNNKVKTPIGVQRVAAGAALEVPLTQGKDVSPSQGGKTELELKRAQQTQRLKARTNGFAATVAPLNQEKSIEKK